MTQDDRMSGYRIRRGEVELHAPDQDALKRMVAAGAVTPTDEAWSGGEWIPVAKLPEFAEPAADDPWSAWSDVDGQDAEAVVRSYVARETDVAELPVEALSPMPRPIVVHSRGRSAEAAAVRPPPERPAPERAPPPEPAVPPRRDASLRDDSGANVISFPRRTRPQPRPDVQAASGPADVPLIRMSRLIPMLMVGVVVLFFGWMYVDVVAAPPPFARAPTARPVAVPAADPFADIERQLRSVTLGDPRPIHTQEQFSDALLLEMQQLGLTAERVDVVVTKWRGRKQDEPASVEVHVRLASADELEHALGATALVVGRYKQSLVCEIPVFDVRVPGGDSDRLKTLDAARAEEFTRGRISLSTYLDTLATSPSSLPAEAPPPTER